MAFGFSPKYVQDLPVEGLTQQQFLVLAIEATKSLGWNIGYTDEAGFIAYTHFSMTSWGEEINVRIDDGIATLKSECTGNQLFDWGKNKGNIEALVSEIETLKTATNSEELEGKYNELKSNFASSKDDELSRHPTVKRGKLAGIFSIFWPREGYFATPIIINLNILIFILMVISGVDFMEPDTKSLILWGANFKPMTLQGEWWRLLTNIFLHIGVIHLLLNMYALLYIGLILEPYLGKARFAAAYLLTGIAASTASLSWHDFTVSAGASGAIFGMYGVFLAMLTTNFIEKAARKTLLVSIGIFVAYNLMNGMKDGIDNAAHIGGLVSGFVIGYLYYPSLKNPERMDIKLGTISALSVSIIFICFMVYEKMPNDIGQYDTKMRTFASMERMALEVYNIPKTASKDSTLNEIKGRGIYYWNQNIDLLNGLEKLTLPEALHEQDRKLIHYCELRLKSYNLIYKSVDEGTDKYKDSLAIYNKDIEAIVNDLKGK